MMRGLVILRGAPRISGSCITRSTGGRSLCTSGDEVTKFPMQHNNAPANHFRDSPPLQAALLEFVAEHGTTNTMPTQPQLNGHGRFDLIGTITCYHGGMAAAAGRFGVGDGARSLTRSALDRLEGHRIMSRL